MNKVVLLGRVGSSELKVGATGTQVLNISLATNEKFKDKTGTLVERVDWHRLSVFGDRAGNLAPYITKGNQLLVTGKIRMNTYEKDGEKKYSTDIAVDEVEFVGTKGSGSSASDEPEERSDDNSPPAKSVNNSEIPF